MTRDTSLYDALGVSPDADAATIKAAHRRKVRDTHPDNGGDADKCAEVNRAWMVLRDPERRARYDAGEDMNAPTDDRMARISTMICSLFGALLDQTAQPERVDMIDLVRKNLAEMKRRCEQQLREIEKHVAKTERARKRLTSRSGAGNLIDHMLRDRLDMARIQRMGVEKEIDTATGAPEVLDDYDWEVDEPESMEQAMGGPFPGWIRSTWS